MPLPKCLRSYGVKVLGIAGRRRGHRCGDGIQVVSFNQDVCSTGDVECIATHIVEVVIDELAVLPAGATRLRGASGIVIEVFVRKGDFVVTAEQ